MYDEFSADYDRFVDWSGRLKFEMPFLVKQLQEAGARRVLDAACGTGRHVLALAEAGFEADGSDFSAGMMERARLNAQAAGVEARFEQAGFGELEAKFGGDSFDALLCLGNSLPHVPSRAALLEALRDFAACLKPGGLLLVQNRNFDKVMRERQRWMEPQSAREGDTEWLFLRGYDFEADGSISFNIITLRREGDKAWTQRVSSTPLRPLISDEMRACLSEARFDSVNAYGDMTGTPFDETQSGNLVVCARKRGKPPA